MKALTGKELGLALCHACHRVIPWEGKETLCPRCGAKVHLRKPQSLSYTWALVITAFIFFFPANILPIMQMDYLGVKSSSTILDGILYFFAEGSYGLGLIILTASILVPLFKILGLVFILLSVHFRWQKWLQYKTIMFRFIRFVGRWSMLDIFVVALLMKNVNFGFLSTIEAGPAAGFFCAVVVFTMLAAITLDTRLLWDVEPSTYV